MLWFISQSSCRLHKLGSFQMKINRKMCPRRPHNVLQSLMNIQSRVWDQSSLKLTCLPPIPTQICTVQTLSPLSVVSWSAPTMLFYFLTYRSHSNLNTLLKRDPGSKGPDFIMTFILEVNIWIMNFRTSQQPLEKRGTLFYKQLTTLNMSSLVQLSEMTTYIQVFIQIC